MSFWKFSPWLSRAIILAVALLFMMISFKFVLDPQHTAAESGITLEPGVGYTNTRAGFGGFPLERRRAIPKSTSSRPISA
jgi:hypothetical protein